MLINLNNLKTFYSALVQKIKGFRGNWNQNDPAADDYIKNRPFYSEDSEIIIFNNAASSDSFTLSEPLAEGVTYTVIFNGTTYQCLAKNYDGYIMIGNNAIYEFDNNITTDTGEPFAIECPAGNPIAYPYYNDSVTEAPSITISYMGELVHKLDKKYIDIPDGIVTENNLATVAISGSYNDLSNQPTVYTDVVRYGTSQSLTTAQKTQARTNINAANASDVTTLTNGVVRHNITQSLTDTQKTKARANIGASDFSGDYFDLENKPCDKIVVEDVVLVSNQTVTVTASSTPILLTSLDVAKGFNRTNYTYTIVINNNTYKGLNVRYDRTICNGGCLGNLYIYNSSAENTGESFVVYATETVTDTDLYFATRDESLIGTTVTVTVIQEGGTTYIPLEDGYIPDSVKYASAEASRTITWDGDITDKDSFSLPLSTAIYYKVSELLFDANNVVSVSCTGEFLSNSYFTDDGVRIIDGVIVANSAGEHKIYLDEAETISTTITVPSAGIYFCKAADYLYVNSAVITYKARSIPSDVVGVVRTINGEAPDIDGNVDIIISSSTEGSTKKFKLTVDDSGTLTATELT